ncbi:MAG: helix-turn-helix domain-containing protein [Clostridiales bacterium]|nr:helix-turn-helix domain-containing protein [Clostridiales bacterium]
MLGDNIRRYREKNKLTQKELAKKLSTSERQISRWENGHLIPSLDTIDSIARVFGVTIFDLLAEESTENEEGQDEEHTNMGNEDQPEGEEVTVDRLNEKIKSLSNEVEEIYRMQIAGMIAEVELLIIKQKRRRILNFVFLLIILIAITVIVYLSRFHPSWFPEVVTRAKRI